MTLESTLSHGSATICNCWVIRRTDGVTLGFTDHDEPLTVDGAYCSPVSGFVATRFEQSLGLEADDMEIEGVIDDERITAEDVRAGRYDDAEASYYVVNWKDTSEFEKVASGNFGDMSEAEDGRFMVEFLGSLSKLLQPSGRTYQRTCDAVLGDSRCRVDLAQPAYQATATVTSVDGGTLALSGIGGYGTDWFTLGKLTTQNGWECGIRQHIGDVVTLWRLPDVTIRVGDTVVVTAGCKQDAETCRVKFNNIVNGQFFHLIPGNDTAVAYPVRGQGSYKGESLFND